MPETQKERWRDCSRKASRLSIFIIAEESGVAEEGVDSPLASALGRVQRRATYCCAFRLAWAAVSAPRLPICTSGRLSSEAAVEPQQAPPTQLGDSRYGAVYAMADDGLGIEDIARKTGLGSAEVEMVISLRPKPGD